MSSSPSAKKLKSSDGTPLRTLPSALSLQIVGRHNRARASVLTLPHGAVRTPVFMPVGTQGAIKGLTAEQMALAPIDCEILLANTYHLALRPGTELLADLGGIHEFMQWPRNVLTDSGGFQMNRIGADIIMALDDVVSSVVGDSARFQEATARTVRWLDRCVAAHAHPARQNLFGIVQGGLDVSDGGLRDQCLDALIARDLPGYAIGGLAGGESKDAFWRVVAKCARRLPEHKPRYLMGVGYPLDLVVCSALGVDMYDCVYPTRTARFGTAIVPSGLLKLKAPQFELDERPLDATCECFVCQQYSRAFLRLMLKKDESGIGAQLLTFHNVAYMLALMRRMRQAIIDGRFEPFVQQFMLQQFPARDYPQWAVDALTEAEIELLR
ncbi:hypothetical protein PybrP1_011904 [[Pythium] brassicae (nom. inval.)]|nr:hypothetical protein PybrP1_011904 [[Pythium] brassicae (nom. inval.)]